LADDPVPQSPPDPALQAIDIGGHEFVPSPVPQPTEYGTPSGDPVTMPGWYNRVITRGWYNRAIDGLDVAQSEADEAARLAAEAAARAASDREREEYEHHEAHALKRYRAAIAARASAALQQSPPPPPLPAQSVDVVPDPAKVAAAVERLRAPRARAPGGDTGRFTGGIRL
jgi:hypothetical protein